MTDIELHYSRIHAVELVKATFEKTPSFAYYESSGDDKVIVGTTTGGVTSFGEQIVVRISTDQAEDRTTISVTAKRQINQNRTANPWKHKSAFMDELHTLRQLSIEEVQQTVPVASRRGGEGRTESKLADAERADVTSEDMMMAATLILKILLGLLLIVFVGVTVVVFLPLV